MEQSDELSYSEEESDTFKTNMELIAMFVIDLVNKQMEVENE